MNIKSIFLDFAKAFEKKIGNDYKIKLQFEISEKTNEIWQVEVNNGKVNIYNDEVIIPEEIYVISEKTLVKLHNNELSPLTALAEDRDQHGEMNSLIQVKNKEDKIMYRNTELTEERKDFLIRLHMFADFYSKDYPTKIIIDNKNGIKLHGVNSIGLFTKNSNGLIHVYSSLKKNEILDLPVPEILINIVKGEGILRINDEEKIIKEKEFFHIKSKVIIENRNDKSLEIFYIVLYDPIK